MKSFETFPSQPEEQGAQKKEKGIENLAEQQEKMVVEEKSRLTEKFKNVSGKAKALLGVFLLSTSIGCASAQAFERGQTFEPKEKSYVTMEAGAENIIESSNSLDVLHREKEFTWGIEYVPKEKDGRGFLAQRYVKIENKTGKTTTLGEYDNIFQAAEGALKILDLPEVIRQHAQRDASIIQTEKDFQFSGLTEPTGNIEGETHIEERNFEGYGIHAKTKVEVDEAGNVVKLLQLSEIEGADFSASESGDIEKPIEKLGSELSPYEESVLEQVRKQEADLLEKGWLELPDGKHGVDVPGSEKIVEGKKIHTEIRRVYDDKGFDVITIWEIDEDGNEIDYKTTDKGETEYQKYLKIIESAKTNK